MLCRICIVQIQPGKHVLCRSCRVYGSHTATWAKSYRSGNISALKDLDPAVGVDDLSDVWKLRPERSTINNCCCTAAVQAGDETKWRIQVVRPHRLALGFTASKRRPKRSTTVTDAVLTLTLCYFFFHISLLGSFLSLVSAVFFFVLRGCDIFWSQKFVGFVFFVLRGCVFFCP